MRQSRISRRSFLKTGAIAFGTLALGSTATLLGCASGTETQSAGSSSSSSSDGVRSASHFVTDMDDFETEVPNNLTMIATIWTPANAVVCMLGQESKLCGITPEFKDSPWANYVFPEISKIPVIIEDGKCDIPEMVEIDPCVTFAEASQQGDIQDIRKADLRAMNVGFDSFDSMRESIAIVADTIGGSADEVAEKWTELFDGNIALVKEKTSSLSTGSRRRVMHAVMDNGTLKASGNTGMVADWIEAAGGVNAIDGEDAVDVTPDSLEEIAPDLLIIGGDDAKDVVASMRTDEEWSTVPVVSSMQVVPNPIGLTPWDGPTPESALQVLWVASQLYPDVMEHSELMDRVRNYYEEFYKFRISKCDSAAILDCENPTPTSDCDDDPEKGAVRINGGEETESE